jgi:hypothetical protein
MRVKTAWNLFASSWNFLFCLAFLLGAAWNVYDVGLTIGSTVCLLLALLAFAIFSLNLLVRINEVQDEDQEDDYRKSPQPKP